MGRVDFERDLNPEQRAAVLAPDGPALVIAAAGTGKTRVLTYRVAYLVERGVDPRRILLLTFTNRAAREMLERARRLVGDSVGGLWGGTFHHMANRILRRHAEVLGFRSDYTILDEDDARRLVRAAADELNLLGAHFPKPEVLLSLFSLAANTEQSVTDVAKKRFDEHLAVNPADIVRVHQAYTARKRALNAMDFDDLLVNGVRLFREHPEILARYQKQFEHILVDEYQDTNRIQAEWVDRLAERHRRLMVVGDDFQSIYSWRGADFRNILQFPRRYPDARIFKLETNYRSAPGILAVANACIAGNPEQFQKVLRPVRDIESPPLLAQVFSGDDQARFVADAIRELVRSGVRADRIAVLYRAHHHALELQLELTRQQVPFVITSGTRFFEQAHVKDVLSLVRLLVNPGDELAFRRLLELLPKVGEKTAERLWSALGKRCDLTDPDMRKRVEQGLPAAAQPEWRAIAQIATNWKEEHLEEDPGEVIYQFVKAFYEQYAYETFENAERRLEDVSAVIDYASNFETAEAFLAETALQTHLDAEGEQIVEEGAEAVRLSTIHQAKGLEWDVVFVLWLAENMFPSARAIADPDGLAEERRLFYVATTRARDRLILCVPQARRGRDGHYNWYTPSRFVCEIPRELFEIISS